MSCSSRWLIASLLASIGIPARAGEVPFPVDRRTLDNGLEVYVVPMGATSEGIVAIATWMAVGSRDEVEPGFTGFAHFFEHLMFHGTPSWPARAREQRLLELGVRDNAWTDLDETVYYTVLGKEFLEEIVELEADRFRNLSLQEPLVRKEAGAVYGELRKDLSDPAVAVESEVRRLAFGTHPYGHLPIGLETDIASMPDRLEAATAFFDRYYRPERAAVLVVGDVEPERAHALVAEHYGRWERGKQPVPAVPAEPPQTRIRRGTVSWSAPTHPRLVMAWKIPRHETIGPGATLSASLQLAADLLDSPTGELVRRLVREEALAYRVDVHRELSVDQGLFVIEVEARQTRDLPRIEETCRSVLAGLAQLPPDALRSLQTRLRYRFLVSQDDPLTVLETVGEAVRRDPDPASLERYRAALGSVSPADVASAVASTLVDSQLTVVTLLPEEEK